MTGKPSYVYFLQAVPNGPIKVGSTASNPVRRLKNLQTGCPWPVRLIGAIRGTPAQEKQIHAALSYFRVNGEWFSPHPAVLAAVQLALAIGIVVETTPARKQQRFDNHASRIIAQLGGTGAVADMVGASPSVISNWKRFGAFPPKTYIAIQAALALRNLTAPNSLWGMPESGAA